MTTIEANIGTAYWAAPGGRSQGCFRPNGKLEAVDISVVPNPEIWRSGKPLWSARIFVGFNVGKKPRWKVGDLIRVVKAVRKKQGRVPDSSFLLQKGLYTSIQGGGLVEENGAQVIVLNNSGLPAKEFTAEMQEMSEVIARQLKQEYVILELQRGGIVQKTFGIGP